MNPGAIKLSVVIPCFNHGEFLPEAVESVRRVRRGDVELVVVDDGSTDDLTREVLGQLRSEGIFVIQQENAGLAAARNAGIRAAQGQYILPLDADNRIHSDYITEGIRILDTCPEVGVVYGDATYFGERSGRWRVGGFNKYRLLQCNYIDACAVYRRCIWEQNQGYDGSIPVQGVEDWDFWLSTLENNWQFTYVPRILFDYRVVKGSMLARTRGREPEYVRFVTTKHCRLYVETVLSLKPSSFKAMARHTTRLFFSKISERMLGLAR